MKKKRSTTSSSSSSSSRSRSRKQKSNKRPDKQKVFQIMHKAEQEKFQKVKENFGYSNEDNPFGDPHLNKQFIWGKKLKKLGNKKKMMPFSEDEIKRKQQESIIEIEKVKQRRAEREMEKIKLEDEKFKFSKEREEELYELWLEKEENFHLEQAKIRHEIRSNYKRMKPIDYFAKAMKIYQEKENYHKVFEKYMKSPLSVLDSMQKEELKAFLDEAEIIKTLEGNDLIYWNSLITLIRYSIAKKEEKIKDDIEFEKERKELLENKTIEELNILEQDIKEMLVNTKKNDFKIDVEYWDNLLKFLEIQKAMNYLNKLYSEFCQKLEMKKELNKQMKIERVLELQEGADIPGPLSPVRIEILEEFNDKIIISKFILII